MIIKSTNMLIHIDNINSNIVYVKGQLKMEVKGHLLLGTLGVAAFEMEGDCSFANTVIWFKAKICHGAMDNAPNRDGIVNAAHGIVMHGIKGCVVSKGAVGKLCRDNVSLGLTRGSIWYGTHMSSNPILRHPLLDPNKDCVVTKGKNEISKRPSRSSAFGRYRDFVSTLDYKPSEGMCLGKNGTQVRIDIGGVNGRHPASAEGAM